MEFATDDTIVAIATPPGRGGIGVIRISGPAAPTISLRLLGRTEPLSPRHATFGRLASATRDEVVATYFKSPHSYTGQDVVEISAHGSPAVLNGIVRDAITVGARLASPGEFTLRAFLNGKRDLVQAEAVGDLIAAATPLQARVAFDQLNGTLTRQIAAIDAQLFDLVARLEASLDFPDEGYHFVQPNEAAASIADVMEEFDRLLKDARRGRMIREGATVVIAGRPNVGKSSLFNVLAGADRAIVTDVAGTTRDLVTESVDVEGIAVTLVDTAGWRETGDLVEREGVTRGEKARSVADLVVVVLDGAEDLTSEDHELLAATEGRSRLVVMNKCDLEVRLKADTTHANHALNTAAVVSGFSRTHPVSAKNGSGIAALRTAIAAALTGDEPLSDTAAISNTRHIALLETAREHLRAAHAAVLGAAVPEEFLLTDLQAARIKLDEVVGARTSDDVLRHIFENFCIGK